MSLEIWFQKQVADVIHCIVFLERQVQNNVIEYNDIEYIYTEID